MLLLANLNTVYNNQQSGPPSFISFSGAWTDGLNCDPSKISGVSISFSGAWTDGQNCDPNKITGSTIAFSGAWTSGENCA